MSALKQYVAHFAFTTAAVKAAVEIIKSACVLSFASSKLKRLGNRARGGWQVSDIEAGGIEERRAAYLRAGR